MSDYPTDDELRQIREWQPHPDTGFMGMLDFIHSIWWSAEWGIRRNGRRWWLSTGGWSGNEDIIAAMQDNLMFWALCWLSSRRGGHYRFVAWKPKRKARKRRAGK